jgi:hypothetical protein
MPPLVDLGLAKLWEVVANGIGGLARPWQIGRVSRAEARAQVEAAKIRMLGMRETAAPRELPAGPPATELVEAELLDDEAFPLIVRAKRRLEYQEAKRQLNLDEILVEAAEDIANEPEVSTDPVDEDWIVRFFGHAQDVSSEEMQTLWSKLLAGEVRRPGSFSLRCLDVVRNLSREEASNTRRSLAMVDAPQSGRACNLVHLLIEQDVIGVASLRFRDGAPLPSGGKPPSELGDVESAPRRHDVHRRALTHQPVKRRLARADGARGRALVDEYVRGEGLGRRLGCSAGDEDVGDADCHAIGKAVDEGCEGGDELLEVVGHLGRIHAAKHECASRAIAITCFAPSWHRVSFVAAL